MNYRLDRLVNQSVGSRLFSNKFYGHLENNGFVAYKNSVYSNMTLVKIVGNYSEVDKNTKLKLQFMLSEYVLVFYFIFIFSLFFIFYLILFEPISLWLKCMPLIMIFISYILIIFPFNFISKDAQNIIEQLLELEM
ncbi:MAG: hypothetical protein P8O16_07540 [Algoriphagus sp.]|uniref:hypothetical protein n=1 Tax=Algoriphagus sp. TaxID=1872435 RepID=UPI002608772E|nr:hypothetical protein [Algoriphagus sp.]MDG1277119.1 hypothetical protein [Algoriphagus sp.]